MKLTVARVADHYERALGGKPKWSAVDLINLAGQQWTNSHSWCYTRNQTQEIALTQDQSYADLPDNMRELVALQVRDTRASYRIFSGVQFILDLRQGYVGVPNGYHIHMAWRQPTTLARPVRTLEIWPTPTATVSDFFKAIFHGGWRDVSQDSDEVPIPPYADLTFMDFCREVALSWQWPERGDTAQRIAAFKQTAMWKDTINADGETMAPLGHLMGADQRMHLVFSADGYDGT